MQAVVVRDADELRGIIRESLKARRVTQTQLASDIGITLKHLNQMLQGHAGISLPMLFSIMEHLDTAVVFLPKGKL